MKRSRVAPPPGSIRGKVVDRGEIPVNHATVRFVLKVPQGQRNFALVASFDETTKVDEEGKFSRLVPGGGIYQVVAEAEGFAPAIKEGVKPGDEIDLILDVGATLAGTVVDRNTGRGVEAAAIEVSVGKGAVTRKTETNAQGEFKVQELPAGKMTVSVEHPLYVPRTGIEQSAEAGESVAIRVELDPGKSIKGQVLAADDGRQIEGALVTVRKKKVRTDPAGRFVVRGLESEMHELRVAADGFQPDQRPINLSGSRVEAVAEIQLNRGATIRGRIQNEKGDPVARSRAQALRDVGQLLLRGLGDAAPRREVRRGRDVQADGDSRPGVDDPLAPRPRKGLSRHVREGHQAREERRRGVRRGHAEGRSRHRRPGRGPGKPPGRGRADRAPLPEHRGLLGAGTRPIPTSPSADREATASSVSKGSARASTSSPPRPADSRRPGSRSSTSRQGRVS